MEDFPGNSNVSKIVINNPVESPETEEAPKVPEMKAEKKPIAEGKVRPKTLGARFKDVFFTETAGFGDYLLKEVIIPGARDVFFGAIEHTLNGFKQGVERQIYGEVRSTTSRTSYGTGKPIRINYNGMSGRSASTRPPIGSRVGLSSRQPRRSNVVQDIILDTREDCREVLRHLELLTDRQGHCTVGDLYSSVNIRTTSTDEQWGWVDVTDASINRISATEYLLTMPRPEPIESEDV